MAPPFRSGRIASRENRPQREIDHARRSARRGRLCVFRRCRPLRCRLRPDLKESAMLVDYGLAAAVTLGLLAYLVYALIRPEKF